ncbi:carboxypeptidase-like regulatory domain-containing protein [bacterium SCSIO 12741]|nr:carboxypeptidase-like regulatory domain-containing protein [bacterium SCSIO 12741]
MIRFLNIAGAMALFLLLSFAAEAQVLVGRMVHNETGKPIRNVHISVDGRPELAVVSKGDGRFQIPVGEGDITLRFSHVAFEPYTEKIHMHQDTLRRDFKLIPKVYQLGDFTTTADRKPESVFHTFVHYVHDFEVMDNRLILITFSRNLKKDPKLTLSGLNQEILDEIAIPTEPETLFRDYQGRVFLEYEKTAYLIRYQDDELKLIEVNAQEFRARVKPCNDTLDQQIFFSDQLWYLPRFNYYSFDTRDSLFRLVRNIVDKELNHMMRWEFYDMTIDQQRQAREMAEFFPNLDKQEMAGIMSGFQNSIYYEEPYAPLFVVNDTILIFDHYSNFLYRYSENLMPLDSQEISYHIPPRRREWKSKVFLDRNRGEFFGLFEKKGYVYLKKINCGNGSFDYAVKLSNQFVEKVRVHDNYAYYIHKPPSSPEKPTIYRERIAER